MLLTYFSLAAGDLLPVLHCSIASAGSCVMRMYAGGLLIDRKEPRRRFGPLGLMQSVNSDAALRDQFSVGEW